MSPHSVPAILGFVLVVGLAGVAAAQIATDGSVGPRMDLPGPDFKIGAGLGTRAGGNLFHSFERFSIARGESATFTGPAAIDNVIARVTGGAPSSIDGSLRSMIAGADLYFINPAGVLFGPNATLNVPGSFHVSTADELRFADGAAFSARPADASGLSVAAPEAFGFLASAPAAITVDRSVLEVPAGEAFSLIGGDVAINGPGQSVRAPGGRLDVTALGRPGSVRIADGAPDRAARGAVSLSGLAELNSGGPSGGPIALRGGAVRIEGLSFVLTPSLGAGSGGQVTIAAREVVLDRGFIGSAGLASGSGGRVAITADRLELVNASLINSSSAPGDNAGSGAVTLTVGSLRVAGGSGVTTETRGAGRAGDLTVNASDEVVVEGFGAITVGTAGGSTGAGGRLSIATPRLVIANGGTIFSSSFGANASGDIELAVGTLEISGGGSVRSATFGQGPAGDITISAADDVLLSGTSSVLSAGTLSATNATPGGRVSVSAPRIEIKDGAFVESATLGSAPGGPIVLVVDRLLISGNASIFADSFGAGDAGSVVIETTDSITLDEGSITTVGLAAGGGRSTLQAGALIDLQDSTLATTVLGGADTTAGDITIDPPVVVLDRSAILANATAGRGGKISITASNLVQSPDSRISASAGPAGIDGTVAVSTPDSDLIGGLVVLDVGLLDADALLRERCAARHDVGASSFTGSGRGGLPPSPDQPLGSAYGPLPGEVRTAAATLTIPCHGAL